MDTSHVHQEFRLRRSAPGDLAFVTALERHPGNRDLVGQWSDAQHLAAMAAADREHWIVESGDDRRAAGYMIVYDCIAARCGIYIKRILLAEKGTGTGKAVLRHYLDGAFRRAGVDFVWLIVFDWNARARAAYRAVGFERFDPLPEEAARFDRAAEPPAPGAFRMRVRRAR